MSARCAQCDNPVPASVEPGGPCPTCGAPQGEERPLELDPQWVAEKAAKQAAAAKPPPNPRRAGAWILGVVSIVMVAVLVVMITQRQPTARGVDQGEGVEITITAPKPVPVKIDGVRAGTTPLSIRLKGRTRPIRIEGNGVIKEIATDRDQTVNLVKP